MEKTVDKLDTVPVYLKISIVEPILSTCRKDSTFLALINSIQNIEGSNEYILRKYLFYLIDANFVKYNGKRKIFTLSQYGVDLLQLIYVQIQRNIVKYEQLTIKVY